MTHEFREQSKPPDVQSVSTADDGCRPPTCATGSHEPRSGDTSNTRAVTPSADRPSSGDPPLLTGGKEVDKRRQVPMRITVVAVPRDRYPAFMNDRDHAFASLSAAARLAEIDGFCGRLCSEMQRRPSMPEKVERRAAA